MNTRKDNNGKALAAWKKMGPGWISSPLKLIAEKTYSRDENGFSVESEIHKFARRAAKRGDGETVMKMARDLK